MKYFFILLVITSLVSCDKDEARIEFDKNQKTIKVISSDYGITNLLISKVEDGKPKDSIYTSIDMLQPESLVDLKNIKAKQVYGEDIDSLLMNHDLMFKVVLTKISTSDTDSNRRIIVFKSANVSDKEIFEEGIN